MRVALTHVYGWPEVRRGAERYLHELAGALHSAGHDVRILTTASAPSRGEVRGVPVHYLRRRHLAPRHLRGQSDEIAFGAAALRWLAGARIDVWHAMGTADAAAAAVLGSVRDIRSVYTDHGFPQRQSRSRRPDRRLHELVVRRVDRYVCVSQAAAWHLREGYGREAVVLSGGVDIRRFTPGAQRSALPTLLFASAADEERKNLPLLLEAVALLRRRGVPVELWLAGPGDQAGAVAAAPSEARAVTRALGIVAPDDLASLYGQAWVTVLPAVSEAFGLVLVESLACGTPVVALDQGGPREIVSPGVGALAAPTAEDLARACEEAIALAREGDIAARCREVAMAWDWSSAIVPRMEEIYGC